MTGDFTNYIGHLTVAFIFFVLTLFIYPSIVPEGIVGVSIFLLTVLGSALVPDLDHHKSKGTQLLDKIILIYVIFMCANWFFNLQSKFTFSLDKGLFFVISVIVLYLAWIGFSNMARPKHRGITHTIVSLVVYSVLLFYLFGLSLAVAAFLGYLSHLVADRHLKLI